MNLFFSSRHPLRSAILLGLIPILFAILSGFISAIFSLGISQILIAQTLSFIISILVGFLLMKQSKLGYENFGFRGLEIQTNPKVLYFTPLIVAELLPFINGFDANISLIQIGLLFLFAAVVGINEELFFRGLIYKILSTKGVKYAVIVSSLLFGIGHVTTALSGSEPIYVAILIIFAGLFGLVCAELVVITKSIIPVILWHGLHDFIANITLETISTLGISILIAQTLILFIYALFLWRQLEFEKLESVL
ncbi:MAG: CPBP family intramembrane glutamic endopeptidase [Acetobacterium sp.]